MDSPSPGPTKLLAMAILLEGGMGLLAVALGWLLGRPPTIYLRWNLAAAGLGCLGSVPLLVVLLVMVRFPIGPFARLQRILAEVVLPLFENCTWLDFALISLLAGVGEELMFRGLIQAALGEWLSPVAGLVLASILFGLAHPITTVYTVMAAIFGLYLGLLWLWSGNLLVVITAHAVYDFLALVYLVRRHRSQAARAASTVQWERNSR